MIEETKKIVEITNNKIDILNKRSIKISLIRLIVFSIFLIIFFISIFLNNYYYLLISFFFIILFVYLFIKHEKIEDMINHLKEKLKVIDNYELRRLNKWSQFKDDGLEYNLNNQYFLEDLDVIGESSLFKYINITKTYDGRKHLINRLQNIELTIDEFNDSINSITDLKERFDFTYNFNASLEVFNNKTTNKNVTEAINSLKHKKLGFERLINISITLILFIYLFLVIVFKFEPLYLILILTINLIMSSIISRIYKEEFTNISYSSDTLGNLDDVYKTILEEKFDYSKLKEYQNDIKEGSISINLVKKLKNMHSFRLNIISNIFLNAILPFNVFILNKYNKIASINKESLLKSNNALVMSEVLVSLCVIVQTKDVTCIPIRSNNLVLEFKNLKHPLLKNDSIANSFSATSNVNIITGSNMSGKTSFLRTIGLNLILANAGCYTVGEYFKFSYMKIFTSMRIKDDISKNISSFYAELLRIKEAIEYQKTNKNMIMLIDEIFRGTNFNDRINGATSMIKSLNKDNVLLFLTTHDVQICDIENIKNYHFNEHYINDLITFDYKIKEGVCKTTNARYLINLIGIDY